MSERFKATLNVHDSKNTRLPIADEFASYRFGRDALAHVHRYLYICEQLIELARHHGPLKVLDIGCGDAYVARTLQASFRVTKADVLRSYVGFDLDDKSLARTRATAPRSFPVELVCGDFTDGGLDGWADKEFDVVVCTEVIEHVQPEFVPPLLADIARLGHWAFVSTPNWTGGSGRLPADHVKEWDTDELLELMREAGLRLVRPRIGTFCQLRNAADAADENVRRVYEFLRPRMDAHLLSLTMARFLGPAAQNVLYCLRCPDA